MNLFFYVFQRIFVKNLYIDIDIDIDTKIVDLNAVFLKKSILSSQTGAQSLYVWRPQYAGAFPCCTCIYIREFLSA